MVPSAMRIRMSKSYVTNLRQSILYQNDKKLGTKTLLEINDNEGANHRDIHILRDLDTASWYWSWYLLFRVLLLKVHFSPHLMWCMLVLLVKRGRRGAKLCRGRRALYLFPPSGTFQLKWLAPDSTTTAASIATNKNTKLPIKPPRSSKREVVYF